MNDKNSIRKQVIEVLNRIPKQLYEDYSYKIASRLYESEVWKQADVIGITISRPPEVDTYQLIRKAWELGKTVAVPKCNPNDKRMTFRTVTEFCQLESVYYGLLEPIVEVTTEVAKEEMDLMIVPGVAYTRNGFRIGFGGGYYDRYLSGYSGNTISLAFTEQLISDFPVGEYDLPVSKIITPKEVIEII
ncbi:5-formyltetrahydrofolate cyclo-ligase [Neobacillus sp. OS1-32]|uniref:5-formyltetrahydrofolate cyclo-ligase n=1 Tax=Neobacillus sp. OS1-32 TaxID=3070682 RepID=UPI0027E0B659|nr:5-formyltetrahydrofolate cyclo-ligase [Neobacillus sp. OS1-32]WML30708.1 5-formyltetrahydrofolate cyclo-ligase [Neobacillus sp. OS1-32]